MTQSPITAERVAEALTRTCGLGHCKAPPGRPCVNLQGRQLPPTLAVHFYRLEPQ